MTRSLTEAAGRLPSFVVSHGNQHVRISADRVQRLYTPDTVTPLPIASTDALTYLDLIPDVMDAIVTAGGGLLAQSGVTQIS